MDVMLAFGDSILSHYSIFVDYLLDFVDPGWVNGGLELVFPHIFINFLFGLLQVAKHHLFTDFTIYLSLEIVKFPAEFGLHFSLLIHDLKRNEFHLLLHLHVLFYLLASSLVYADLVLVVLFVHLGGEVSFDYCEFVLNFLEVCHEHCERFTDLIQFLAES